MSQIKSTGIDLEKAGQLLNALLHYGNTSAINSALTVLAQIGYDTDLKRIKTFDGTSIQTILQSNDIVQDFNSVSSSQVPSTQAVQTYIYNTISSSIKIRGSFTITVSPANYPKAQALNAVGATQIGDGSGTGYLPTIKSGDAWYVKLNEGNVGPYPQVVVEPEDLIVAIVDNATNNHSDWLIISKQIDNADTSTAGIIQIATSSELSTGTNVGTTGAFLVPKITDLKTYIDAGKVVGVPTDGVFGTTNSAGLFTTDIIPDGFDKVVTILDKLVPQLPPLLSTKTLSVSSEYSATQSSSGTVRTHVIDSTTPTIVLSSDVSPFLTAFYNGDSGTLTANVDGVSVGSRVLTTSDDSGNYGSLHILTDADPWIGIVGKAGFWKQLTSTIIPSTLSLASHTAQLLHTTTGNTPILTFYIDNPTTTSASSRTATGSGTGRFVSGVPSLATSDSITVGFTANSVIGQFYNTAEIGSADSSQTTSAISTISGVQSGPNYSISGLVLSVNINQYIEQTIINCRTYNSKNVSVNTALTSNIRIDTVSPTENTIRYKSGQGQYPAQGVSASQFGDTFVSSTDLNTSGNEELQLLNGLMQYPSGNYTSNLPTNGPNYTSVPAGSYSNYRWYTIKAVSSASNVVQLNLTFNSTTGFSGAIMSNWLLYVRVVGGTPTTGWIDGNAAYPGVGSPTNNGDAALIVGSSTSTFKAINFSTVKTGDIWVRIGIPAGDTKKFSYNITASTI